MEKFLLNIDDKELDDLKFKISDVALARILTIILGALATSLAFYVSTIGGIIPPSIMMIVLANAGGISVGALFAGGIARNYDFDRMVDELALNWRDTEEAAWHHGVLKVPLGSVVELTADRHKVYRWYAPPDQMAASDYNEAEAVATARALLDTAAEKALRWAKKPMLALSK